MFMITIQSKAHCKFKNADAVCAISVISMSEDWFLNGSYLETLK